MNNKKEMVSHPDHQHLITHLEKREGDKNE